MLSRVAENLYWFSRYVRRAENLARLVSVSSELQLDLPRAARFAWRPLVETLGAGEDFEQRHGANDAITDNEVIEYLLTEPGNPLSLRAVVNNAREILRTVRETLPQGCWVAINDIHLHVESNAAWASSRRHRLEFLDRVIDGCLRASALLTANVSRDIGYQFLRLGTGIEQADMTTRIIDAAASGLIVARNPDDQEAFRDMQWMSLLHSLAAYQMYRRHLRQRVSVELALQFLLKDREFPRSVLFCLSRVQGVLPLLPQQGRSVQQALKRGMGLVFDADPRRLSVSGACDFTDRVQIQLGALHNAIQESYFQV